MSALDELVKDCLDADIAAQCLIFDDAFLPGKAATDLAQLKEIKRIAAYIVLNRRSFTVGDVDGMAGAIMDELAARLEPKP
jgi:hypothetical protein